MEGASVAAGLSLGTVRLATRPRREHWGCVPFHGRVVFLRVNAPHFAYPLVSHGETPGSGTGAADSQWGPRAATAWVPSVTEVGPGHGVRGAGAL